MGYNKFIVNGVVKQDLTSDTVTAETLANGRTAHDASGSQITGTAKLVGNIDLSSENVTVSKTSTTVTVTLSNATGAVSIVKNGDNFNAALSGNTITVTKTGPFAENGTVIVTVAETTIYNATSKTITVTVEGPVLCTWADGTDEEVASMIEAAQNGDIDLTDYWAAGDIREYDGINYMLNTGIEYVDENDQTQTSIFSILYDKGSIAYTASRSYAKYGNSGYWHIRTCNHTYASNNLPSAIAEKTKTMRWYQRYVTNTGGIGERAEYSKYCYANENDLIDYYPESSTTENYVLGRVDPEVSGSTVTNTQPNYPGFSLSVMKKDSISTTSTTTKSAEASSSAATSVTGVYALGLAVI
mgnify:CR=1 FL=1